MENQNINLDLIHKNDDSSYINKLLCLHTVYVTINYTNTYAHATNITIDKDV